MFRVFCTLVTAGFIGASAFADDVAQGEKRAREALAKNLLKLSQSLDMKEAKYEESGVGGRSYDANTGNSFLSNTTIHYNVESTCQEWVGGQYCNKWLDPFISEHGFGGDFSPLEGAVAQEWKARQTIDGGGQYRIWQIARQGGGANTDADGKLDRSGITDWRLLPEVRKKLENIGEQSAVRQMTITFDDDAPKGKAAQGVMPNMESLRMMASRWTKMFRNRLVSNLAEMRVGDKPTEFRLNEESPDCESYVQAMKTQQEQTRTEERLEPQARLDMETMAADLQQRYKQCVALRRTSVNAVNPIASGGEVSQGDAESERIDKWRTRVNIAMIDKVGIDVNSIPKPSNGRITQRDLASDLAVWEDGGRTMKGKKSITNRQQLQSYNNQLELAAVGMQEVAMRSQNIAHTSDTIKKYKIENGQYNAVKLNSLTPEMRGELSETAMKKSGVMKKGGPEDRLEDNVTQLTITRR